MLGLFRWASSFRRFEGSYCLHLLGPALYTEYCFNFSVPVFCISVHAAVTAFCFLLYLCASSNYKY